MNLRYPERMKIVILTGRLGGYSGWSRYATDLGKALSREGHDVTAIVAKKSNADWCTEIPLLWGDMCYLDRPMLVHWTAWRLKRLLQKIQPDVIHAMAEPLGLLLPSLKAEPYATCMTIHGTYSVVPFLLNDFAKKRFAETYHAVDRIFSVSNFTKNHLREFDPVFFEQERLEEKIHVLPNALDLSGIKPVRDGKPDRGEKYIIGVGAVKERKGYIHAVEACAAFRKKHPMPFHYDIFGALDQDPPYVAKLRARIAELGLDQHVRLRGKVPDDVLKSAYAQADLFLLMSIMQEHYFEGYGLVFLEASAAGVPVIGPQSGGCPEAIDEGKSGYVCDPTDADSVTARMEDILLQRVIRREDCIAWAQKNTAEEAARKLIADYEALAQA